MALPFFTYSIAILHFSFLLPFFIAIIVPAPLLPISPYEGQRQKMSRPGDWNCRSCQHLNFQRRDMCQRCGDPKSGGGGGDFSSLINGGGRGGSAFGYGGSDVRPGDWYCTVGNCGAHNFASRSSCFKCGAFKDDTSGGGFDFDLPRSRGTAFGFGNGAGSGRTGGSAWKSGDWICARSGCNEHNFASRIECFRCSAPRDSY